MENIFLSVKKLRNTLFVYSTYLKKKENSMNDGKDKINIYHTIRRGHRGPWTAMADQKLNYICSYWKTL
jgi:hypothetical protein